MQRKINEKHENAYNWVFLKEYIEITITYYYVEQWVEHALKRDRKWFALRKPDLEKEWNLVLQYRKEGLPSSYAKKPKPKTKPEEEEVWLGQNSDNDNASSPQESQCLESVGGELDEEEQISDNEQLETVDQDDDEARAKKAKFTEYVATKLSNSNVKAAKKEDAKIPIPKVDLSKCLQKAKDDVKNIPDIRSFGVTKPQSEKPYESDVFDQ